MLQPFFLNEGFTNQYKSFKVLLVTGGFSLHSKRVTEVFTIGKSSKWTIYDSGDKFADFTPQCVTLQNEIVCQVFN